MSDNPNSDIQAVPDAKLHKGYVWVLVIAVLVGAWFYFSNETRNLDQQQKFYFWALEEQYPQDVKDFAAKHTLEQLEDLCRAASEAQNAQLDSPLSQDLQEGSKGLLKGAIQQNTADICNAYIYKSKRTKIDAGDLEGITF